MAHTCNPSILAGWGRKISSFEPSLGNLVRLYLKKKKKKRSSGWRPWVQLWTHISQTTPSLSLEMSAKAWHPIVSYSNCSPCLVHSFILRFPWLDEFLRFFVEVSPCLHFPCPDHFSILSIASWKKKVWEVKLLRSCMSEYVLILLFQVTDRSRALWCMPVTWGKTAGGSGLHSKFKTSLNKIVRPCLKKTPQIIVIIIVTSSSAVFST